MKKVKKRFLIVRSRNNSCKPLKHIEVPHSVILRLGSTTKTEAILKHRNPKNKLLEINSPKACFISGNKFLMKRRFTHGHIPTAEWFDMYEVKNNRAKVKYYLAKWDKIIIKHEHSSKGKGIYLISDIKDYIKWEKEHSDNICDHVFEKYYTYSKEYRIHVTKDGCFYACRKMLKNDAEVRWHRHDNNSVWILEDNPLFNKPNNWDDIVKSCVNALKAIGLDIAAFDVKVQTKDKDNPKWIVLESNSAPALGEVGLERYKEQLNKMIWQNLDF